MFDIILAVLFAYNNSTRAKKKGQNTALWVFITIISVFMGEMIGGLAVLFFFNNGVVNMKAYTAGHERWSS
jgi:hypothetical protein